MQDSIVEQPHDRNHGDRDSQVNRGDEKRNLPAASAELLGQLWYKHTDRVRDCARADDQDYEQARGDTP